LFSWIRFEICDDEELLEFSFENGSKELLSFLMSMMVTMVLLISGFLLWDSLMVKAKMG